MATTTKRAPQKRVQLDARARAFVFLAWGYNLERWTAARGQWSGSEDPLVVHVAGYPDKRLPKGLRTAHLRSALAAALSVKSVVRLDELLRPVCEQRLVMHAAPDFADVTQVMRDVQLKRLPSATSLADELASRWASSPPKAADSPVVAFVEQYEGPMGKLEAAAEQFSLPIDKVAEHVRGRRPLPELPPSLPAVSTPRKPAALDFGSLQAAQRDVAALREENAQLRRLLVHYLGKD